MLQCSFANMNIKVQTISHTFGRRLTHTRTERSCVLLGAQALFPAALRHRSDSSAVCFGYGGIVPCLQILFQNHIICNQNMTISRNVSILYFFVLFFFGKHNASDLPPRCFGSGASHTSESDGISDISALRTACVCQ